MLAWITDQPMTRRQHRQIQQGFTIVELMIATMVFSVILVVITTGVLKFTNSYYKGLNSSATQTTARNLITSITQGVQYAGNSQLAVQIPHPTDITKGVVCVGNVHYYYTLGSLAGSGYGVYETSQTDITNCDPTTTFAAMQADPTGRELLAPHMRLTDIHVGRNAAAPATTLPLYDISVGIAFADDDSPGVVSLLCATSLPDPGGCDPSDGDLTSQLIADPDNGPYVTCKSQSGSQFCAVVHLNTTVQARLTGN